MLLQLKPYITQYITNMLWLPDDIFENTFTFSFHYKVIKLKKKMNEVRENMGILNTNKFHIKKKTSKIQFKT